MIKFSTLNAYKKSELLNMCCFKIYDYLYYFALCAFMHLLLMNTSALRAQSLEESSFKCPIDYLCFSSMHIDRDQAIARSKEDLANYFSSNIKSTSVLVNESIHDSKENNFTIKYKDELFKKIEQTSDVSLAGIEVLSDLKKQNGREGIYHIVVGINKDKYAQMLRLQINEQVAQLLSHFTTFNRFKLKKMMEHIQLLNINLEKLSLLDRTISLDKMPSVFWQDLKKALTPASACFTLKSDFNSQFKDHVNAFFNFFNIHQVNKLKSCNYQIYFVEKREKGYLNVKGFNKVNFHYHLEIKEIKGAREELILKSSLVKSFSGRSEQQINEQAWAELSKVLDKLMANLI